MWSQELADEFALQFLHQFGANGIGQKLAAARQAHPVLVAFEYSPAMAGALEMIRTETANVHDAAARARHGKRSDGEQSR